MKPPDVVVTVDAEQELVTWTRGDVAVSYHPSDDKQIRARQEADLTAHLDARTAPSRVALTKKATVGKAPTRQGHRKSGARIPKRKKTNGRRHTK